jgi:hypothetical protein
MIEICRESPYEARQGPILDEYEHGRAQREEVHDSAILDLVNQREGDCHRRGKATEDNQA